MKDQHMSNDLTTTTATENIRAAAREDAGTYKILKFKRGTYSADGETIALGTEFIAQPIGWCKEWIKFRDGKVADRHLYRVALKEKSAARLDLDDTDESTWEPGLDGKKQDPWILQFLLPFENQETGELVMFVTSSVFGKRAVAKLCDAWANRRKRGLPIVELQCGSGKSKYGPVPCPEFKVVRWDDVEADGTPEVLPPLEQEMSDEIPF